MLMLMLITAGILLIHIHIHILISIAILLRVQTRVWRLIRLLRIVLIVHLLCDDDATNIQYVCVVQEGLYHIDLPKNSLLLCMCSGSLTYHTVRH